MDKNVYITGIYTTASADKSLLQNYEKKENYYAIKNIGLYSKTKIKTRIDRSAQFCMNIMSELEKKADRHEVDNIGLITISRYGCIKSKRKYLEQLNTLENKQFASPKDFIQSICNIPNAIATIEFGIKNFSNHYVGDGDATVSAIWQGTYILKKNLVDVANIVAFNSLDEKISMEYKTENAILNDIREAAAGIRIEKARTDISPIFEICGFGFSTNEDIHQSINTAILKAVNSSNISLDQIKFMVTNIKMEITSISYPSISVINFEDWIGETFSASPIISLNIIKWLMDKKVPYFLTQENEKYSHEVIIKKGDIFLLVMKGIKGNISTVCLKCC